MVSFATNMFIFQILMSVFVISSTFCQKMCAPISSFQEVVTAKYLQDASFQVLEGVGLIECVKECQRRSRCESINYRKRERSCELNYEFANNNDNNIIHKEGSIYTKIDDWSKRIAGACSKDVCPKNSTCTDVNNQPVCNVTYCDVNTAVLNASVDLPSNSDKLFKEGEKVTLSCPIGYHSNGPVCGSKGIWNGEGTCKPPPRDCDAVRACEPSAGDGNYWILPTIAVKAVMVFCTFSDSQTTAYISLNESDNYSVFPKRTECPSSVEYCGTTRYTKYELHINENFKLTDNVRDFASNDCNGKLPRIGLSGGCSDPDWVDCTDISKYFKINTTGTGFIIDPTIRWTTYINRYEENRVIQGRCSCRDQCHPILGTPQLPVILDPSHQPQESAATVLDCDTPVDDGPYVDPDILEIAAARVDMDFEI